MTEIRVHKGVGLAVELPSPGARTHKAIAYAVEQAPSQARVHKAVGYLVEQADVSGDAFQPTSGLRPVYRAGPKAYVEFTTGTSLITNLPFSGSGTLLILLPDGSSTIQAVTFTAGIYTLPTVNFNQAILVLGSLSAIAKASLIASMRTRAGF